MKLPTKTKTPRDVVSTPQGTSAKAQRLAAILTLRSTKGEHFSGGDAMALAIDEALAKYDHERSKCK